MRLVVEISPTSDDGSWADRHARGEVPDRSPYGLDRIGHYGPEVVFRRWPRGTASSQLSRVAHKAGGSLRWVESGLAGSPVAGAGDVRLAWDERSSIPSVLDPRSRRAPMLSGVIWMTEPDELPGWLRLLAAGAVRRMDALFVMSSAQVGVLRDVWRVEADRIHVVPFGVDADFWHASGIPGEPVPGADGTAPAARIVSVGNDRHRAHAVLLAAMPRIHEATGATLDLVTSAPLDVPAGWGRRHARMSHPELRSAYERAALSVVSTAPNVHCSGLTATLEAMSMGLPVVTTRNPGMDEFVTHGRNGLLVPPGDPDALAQAVLDVLADPDWAQALGKVARADVEAVFNTERQARDLAALAGRIA